MHVACMVDTVHWLAVNKNCYCRDYGKSHGNILESMIGKWLPVE